MALLLILLFLHLSHGLAISEKIQSTVSLPYRSPQAERETCRDTIGSTSAFPDSTIARRGCCSHHNGVCG